LFIVQLDGDIGSFADLFAAFYTFVAHRAEAGPFLKLLSQLLAFRFRAGRRSRCWGSAVDIAGFFCIVFDRTRFHIMLGLLGHDWDNYSFQALNDTE
jgi:hypothetical protein